MANGGWSVDASCPQCGGPVTLDEAERLLACPFCRVRLYVATDGYPRYCIPPRDGPAGRIVMVPYWRRRGSRYRCIPWQVSPGILDFSLLACPAPGMPRTLGVRPQAMRLRFAAPETDTTYLEPVGPPSLRLPPTTIAPTPFDDLLQPEEEAFEELLLASTSIVYSPVRLAGGVLDAVLNRRLTADTGSWDTLLAAGPKPLAPLRFLPTLCPDCGWQLDGRPNTLVLLCGHCQTAWRAGVSGLVRVEHRTLPATGSPAIHIPFWRVVPTVSGLRLGSWADFARFANLPRRILPAWAAEPLVIWVPAFHVGPEPFLRYSRNLTSVHPPLPPAVTGDEDVTSPATVSQAAAVTLAPEDLPTAVEVLLFDVGQPKRAFFPRLAEIQIEVAEASLVYVPLYATSQEFVNLELHLSVPRNLISQGR